LTLKRSYGILRNDTCNHENSLNAQSDEQLVNDLRLGLEDAFASLYERYKRSIYSFCLKLSADRFLAEDATHDTFIKMQQNIHTLNNVSIFRSWLYTIARNQVYKLLHKQKSNGRLIDELVWSDDNPDIALELSEEREIIAQCINALKPEYREVLTLREFEQLSYTEIAVITGDSESSVKSRLFKARRALAVKLKPYFK
jgi:RNA polymerase sigma-70 factor (ECF subfamily)